MEGGEELYLQSASVCPSLREPKLPSARPAVFARLPHCSELVPWPPVVGAWPERGCDVYGAGPLKAGPLKAAVPAVLGSVQIFAQVCFFYGLTGE